MVDKIGNWVIGNLALDIGVFGDLEFGDWALGIGRKFDMEVGNLELGIEYLFNNLIIKNMAVLRFEDLRVWQESRILCIMIYTLVKSFPDDEKYNIVKHLRENGRGIPANIAEGFCRFYYQESIRFYIIARGCLGEMKSDLYLSLDLQYIPPEKFQTFLQKVEKIHIMLNSLVKTTKKCKRDTPTPNT